MDQSDYKNLAGLSDVRAREASSSSRRSVPPAAWMALAVVAAGFGYMMFMQQSGPAARLTDPEREEFSTTTPIPPSVRPKELAPPEDTNIVKIEPQENIAPPPPMATPVAPNAPIPDVTEAPPIEAPAAPAAPAAIPAGPGNEVTAPAPAAEPDDSEEMARLRALREAEAARLRDLAAAEEADRQKRLRSDLLVFDGDAKKQPPSDPAAAAAAAEAQPGVDPSTTQAIGDADDTNRVVLTPDSGPVAVDVAQQSEPAATPPFQPNESFLDRAAKRGVDTSIAGKLARPDAIIPEGAIIHGVLESAINSDLPGVIRATVAQDVWSLDGRRILIPRGARLIGEYSSGIQNGQSRILIAWNRVITGNGISVQLGSTGADALGRAGMAGKVDRKTIQRYGSALLLTIAGGASQYVSSLGQPPERPDVTTTRVDPVTGEVITTTVQGNQRDSEARQIGAQTVSQALTQMATQALSQNINIPPTIHIRQGERVIVMVRRDLDFSALYRDPVYEEYLRLKGRGRGGDVIK